MQRQFRLCAFSAALVVFELMLPSQSEAQLLQGTMNGNVTDSSQGAIAGASLLARNLETNFTRETVTNPTGSYTIPTLPPGTYSLTVSMQGFERYTQTGIVIASEAVTRADVVLTVGQITETVTVAATAATLQSDRADVRSEITSNALANLPVPIGRNYQMTFLTLPGVSPPQNSNSFTANSSRGLTFSVNGSSINHNNTRVDGAGTTNMTAVGTAMYVPALDAIETVSLSSNAMDAEQGAGGSSVNITMKSGTNNLHGAIFEDHADQHLKAYPWASDRTQAQPKYIHNQFGGSVGGPIVKNKLFYFASYDGTRYAQQTPVPGQVPTRAMKSGDLSRSPTPIYDPLTGDPDGGGRSFFAGGIIPPSRIDSGVRNLLGNRLWADPNVPGTGGLGLSNNYLVSGNSTLHRDQFDNKLNWNAGSKLSAFVRFGYARSNWTTPEMFGDLGGPNLQNSNTASGAGAANVFSGTISGTYVFNSHLIADAYFGYSRNDSFSAQVAQEQNLGWTLLQIPGLNTANLPKQRQLQEGGLPTLTIDGFAVLGSVSRFQPQAYRDPEKNYTANINWLSGNHNIRAGFDSDFQKSNQLQYQTPTGAFISGAGGFHFTQGTTQLKGGPAGNDYNAFASFLLGLPQDSGKIYQFPDEYFTATKWFAIYIRDTWQVTPKLTVSYGVRADYFPWPTRPGANQSGGWETYNSDTNQMLICGIGSTPKDCGITKNKYHILPRLGVAYRLGGATVIRAGIGMTTDPTSIASVNNRRLNFPYILGQILLPPNSLSYATTLRQGIPVLTPPDLTSGVIPVPAAASIVQYNNGNWVRGAFELWNFTIERRLKDNWLVSAGYVATRDVDSQQPLEQNWSAIGAGTAGQILNRKFGRTGNTTLLGTEGTNSYHGLQLRAGGKLGQAITLNVAYSFAKALAWTVPSSTVGGSAIPEFYRLKNYGPASIDITRNFQATMIGELPFGAGKRWASTGLPSKILGGWSISDVFSAYGGRPFSALSSNSTLNATNSQQFADCLSPPRQTGNIFQWYDKSAFAAPSAGRFGTCGPFSLRGPRLINTDVGVDRRFPLTDRLQLKFRVEMFNVGNTPHHTTPGANSSTGSTSNNVVTSSSFMQAVNIANVGRDGIDERAFRFSLRLQF